MHDLVGVGAAAETALPELDAGTERMHVRVVERRQKHPSAEILDPGRGTDESARAGVAADVDDAIAAHCHRLRPGARGVDGVNGGGEKDAVGSGLGGPQRQGQRQREPVRRPPCCQTPNSTPCASGRSSPQLIVQVCRRM